MEVVVPIVDDNNTSS
nr:hypothetical protein [Tanacetum cinerariifolium]